MIRRALRFLCLSAAFGLAGCDRTMPTEPGGEAKTLSKEESEGLPRTGKVVFLVEDMGETEDWQGRLEDAKKKDPVLAASARTSEDVGTGGHVGTAPAAPGADGTEPGVVVPESAPLPEENSPLGNQDSIEPTIVPAAPGSAAPVAILPAPETSRDRINQLVNKYDLVDIGGSAATIDVLDEVDALMSRFPTDSFKDLRINFETVGSPLSSTNQLVDNGPWADDFFRSTAYWLPVTGDDHYLDYSDPVKYSDVAGGVITVASEPGRFNKWSMAMALAEHVVRYQKATFGRELMTSLGYTLSAEGASSPYASFDRYYMLFLDLDASRVSSTSYATSLGESIQSHLPDLIAHYLLKNDPAAATVRLNGSFELPEGTRLLLGEALGF